MRVISPIFFLILIVGQLKAQDFVYFDEPTLNDSSSVVKLKLERIAASNALTYGLINNYLFSDRFDADNKDAFIQGQQKRINLINQSSFGLSQIFGSNERLHQFDVGYSNEWYATGAKKIGEMALFGNAHLAGEEINSSKTELLMFKSFSLSYKQRRLISEHWNLSLRAGLDFYQDIEQYRAEELFLQTEESGEYIDVAASNLQFYPSSSYWDGLGAHIGFTLQYEDDNRVIAITSDKIRLAFLNKETQYTIDTNFRFEGLELQGEDLLERDLTELSDSLIDQALYSSSNTKNWQLLPTPLKLSYMHKLSNKHKIGAQFSALSLGRYGAEIMLVDQIQLAPNFSLRSSLSYGDFTGVSWVEEAEYILFDQYHIYVGVAGLHGLLLPNLAGRYGVSAGVALNF